MKKLVMILLAVVLTAAPAFAQKSFTMRYNEAVEYYTSKKYDKAITVLEAAKKSPGVTKAQITQANKLLNQCRSAKQKLADLNLSKEVLNFEGDGQTDSIYVTAGKKWDVTDAPDWLEVWAESDVLYVKAGSNESGDARKGTIEVSMGKERTAYVLVTQEKRLETVGSVAIRTIPDRAFIYVDREAGMLSERFELREGKHTIRIEKNGYERKDTTVVIGRNVDKGEIEYVFRLTPTFSTISVDIRPEEGYTFDSYPTLDVSGNAVNLHPSVIKSFNVDKDINYYEMYDGNRITLHPGQYVLKVEAEGFIPQTRDISVAKGAHGDFEFVLTPVTGTLSLSDEEYAEGAVAFLDDVKVGTVPVDGLKVKSGNHVLRFEKEGFMTSEPEYVITVPENKEAVFKVTMQRYSAYNVVTDPAYCKIYLDGKYQGAAPVRLILNEGEHGIRIEKNGYYPVEKWIIPDFATVEHTDSITLVQSYPLLITADKDSLGITIYKGSGNSKVVYAGGVKTPATVNIPVSDTPYKLELTRNNRKRAWKGNIHFKDPDKSHVNLLSWGTSSTILGADWYAVAPKADFSSSLNKGYYRLAEGKFGGIDIFPGLTTYAFKASAFMQSDPSQQLVYPEPAPAEADYKNVTWLPALSTFFINEEFRLGGALLHHLDANLLVTYAWNPGLRFMSSLEQMFCFSHMEGHDVFIGGEINSRIKVINAHVKAGMQGYWGKANICRPGEIKNETPDTRFVSVPYKNVQFVVTLGFTLGVGGTRGQNILRIF